MTARIAWDDDYVPVLPEHPEELTHFEFTLDADTWYAWRVLNADPEPDGRA